MPYYDAVAVPKEVFRGHEEFWGDFRKTETLKARARFFDSTRTHKSSAFGKQLQPENEVKVYQRKKETVGWRRKKTFRVRVRRRSAEDLTTFGREVGYKGYRGERRKSQKLNNVPRPAGRH